MADPNAWVAIGTKAGHRGWVLASTVESWLASGWFKLNDKQRKDLEAHVPEGELNSTYSVPPETVSAASEQNTPEPEQN